LFVQLSFVAAVVVALTVRQLNHDSAWYPRVLINYSGFCYALFVWHLLLAVQLTTCAVLRQFGAVPIFWKLFDAGSTFPLLLIQLSFIVWLLFGFAANWW
jgi:hypothetical protein